MIKIIVYKIIKLLKFDDRQVPIYEYKSMASRLINHFKYEDKRQEKNTAIIILLGLCQTQTYI